MREGDRDENHKENCNYKEEGHVARLIVSVASHDRREIVGGGGLLQKNLPPPEFVQTSKEGKYSAEQREIVKTKYVEILEMRWHMITSSY
jgi:hypothetical protein